MASMISLSFTFPVTGGGTGFIPGRQEPITFEAGFPLPGSAATVRGPVSLPSAAVIPAEVRS